MSTSVSGIGELVATFQVEDTIALGDLVVLSDQQTVKKAQAEEELIGVCVSINGNYAGIQLKGGTVLNCQDTSLTVGYHPLKVLAENNIAKADNGAHHLVVRVDNVNKIAEVIL